VPELTQRDRRLVAEVIDRYMQRDIDRRGIRDTFVRCNLTCAADGLLEFTAGIRLDADGDDVDLLREAIAAVDSDTDGRLDLADEDVWPQDPNSTVPERKNYEALNRADLDKAVRQLGPGDGIHYKCFNREEAEDAKRYMAETHPGVPFTTSWMEFHGVSRAPKKAGEG